ncbi:MAG TPA: outer membrane beta-barrel protein [Saprospiraceae bacterium]|nr:outer membrane beta-barrel protein [Saprospiraceae bacterium]HMQ83718.1 outer membrane beta-barrel protein [Saprospiraceae bacterium]
MQDNKEQYHHPELADKGWSAMRDMLDKEMPVGRKRKRPVAIWWWSTIGLGVLLLIALQLSGYSLWNYFSPTLPKIEEKTPLEPALIPPVAEIHPTQKLDKATLPEAKTSDRSAARTTTPPTATSNASNFLILTPETVPLLATTTMAETITENTFQPLEPKLASAKTMPLLDDLPKIPLNALPEIPRAADFHASNPKKPWIWMHGVETGLFNQAWVNQGGWNIGAFAQVQKPHSRVYAKVGIRYSLSNAEFLVYQNQITGDSLVDQNNTDFPVSQNDIEAGYSSSEPGVLFTSLQPRHQIGIPIEIGYRLGKRWAVQAGIQANYLISSQRGRYFSEDLNASFVRTNKLFFYDSENEAISLHSANSAPRDSYRSFHLALSGGIAYHFQPKLRLSLQYRHGLTNLTPSAQFASRLKGLELMLSKGF